MGSLPVTAGTRAAIYCRVSTNKQEDNYSLETQEASCRGYAQSHGFAVLPEYTYLEAHSGVDLWGRPKLTALREAIRAKAIDVVICHSIDRLSRDPVHLGVIVSEADHKGVQVVFVTEPLDDSLEGQLIRFVRGYAGKIEHAKFRERSERGQRARAQSGALLPNGQPAYGYQWRPWLEGETPRTAYDPDPAKASHVKRVFETVAAGGSLTGLKAAFEAEGLPSPSGLPHWSTSTLKTWIRNPLYKGEPQMWRTQTVKSGKGGRMMAVRPEADRIKLPAGVVPPLVSPELWQRANDQLDRNREQSTRRNKHASSYLLRAGFVVCPHCGRNLGTLANGTLRYRTTPLYQRDYGCPFASIDAATLDREVWALVEGIIKDPVRIIEQITQSFAADDPTKADREAITQRLAEIKRAQRMQAITIERLDDPELAAPNIERLRQLGQERKQLETDLADLEQRQAGWASGLAAAERLLEMFYAEQTRLDDLSYEERRALMGWLGVKVKLYPQGVEPRWTLTTSIALPDMPEPQTDDTGTEPVAGAVFHGNPVFEPGETYPAMAETIGSIANNALSPPTSSKAFSTFAGSISAMSADSPRQRRSLAGAKPIIST